MVFMSPIHKALFGFHTKSHFLIFSILTLHFNFISFHLHFFTYTSHLGPLGPLFDIFSKFNWFL